MSTAEESDNRFRILKFSRDNLCEALSNGKCNSSQVKESGRFTYICEYLESTDGINAKTIVVEYSYTDGDYLDDFAAYYVKCFSRYERRCRRLHFFSREVSRDQLLRLVQHKATPEEEQEFREAYIGFVVARPLPEAIIGRTVLRTYASDGGRRRYRAIRCYNVNLFGIPLAVNSLAYQEQDRVLAACVTVSLWSSFHKTSELFGTPEPRPSAITEAANRFVGRTRPIPSRGLIVEQIATAIRDVGLEPEIFPVSGKTPILSLVRGYLEFGLPVILGVMIPDIGLHAMTLVGYSLIDSKPVMSEVTAGVSCVPMTGLRIDKFYTHDDQIGPYAKIRVQSNSQATQDNSSAVLFTGSWKGKKGTVLELHPRVVVIPAYNKIRVTFLDIQKWLTRLSDALPKDFQTKHELEWDVHLTSTNAFKTSLAGNAFSTEAATEFCLVQHPRFIWRIALRVDNQLVIELLADATDMDRSFPMYAVIWHDKNLLKPLIDRLQSDQLHDLMARLLTEPYYVFLRRAADRPFFIRECLD